MSGYCHFEFRLNRKSDFRSIEIPLEALFQDSEGQHGTWIIDRENHTVSFGKAKLGLLTQGGVTILEGLQPGDWIVTASDQVLQEGDLVKIMPPEILRAK
jgi:multidrug efflux pump subunit AcrA (membrane-fusion protein)